MALRSRRPPCSTRGRPSPGRPAAVAQSGDNGSPGASAVGPYPGGGHGQTARSTGGGGSERRRATGSARRPDRPRRAPPTPPARRDPIDPRSPPGRRGPGDVAAEIERLRGRVEARRAAVPAIRYPPQLPVSARRDDLAAAIRDHQVVIVAGETGSGKTTQLPKICLELGRGVRGMIGHTQPRRIAARTVAERIAEELGRTAGRAGRLPGAVHRPGRATTPWSR